MTDQNGTGVTQVEDTTTVPAENTSVDKGKGKAAEIPRQDVEMEDDDEEDDEEEESGIEDHADDVEEPEDEDNMEEITMDNIVGSRTRGKTIDFAKAAQEQEDEVDEDEDDDEDYEEQEGMEED